MRQSIRVKICGLTNLDDAHWAAQQGADLLGFIFYAPSPRYVPPERVREIVTALREAMAGSPRFVGVFVNAPRREVEETLAYCRLDLAQLHGDEPPEFVAAFQGRAFKACNPRTLSEAETLAEQYAGDEGRLILLDAYHPRLRGGTGHTADWAMAARIAGQYPLLLAGGLNPNNVRRAVQTVRPWGVDASSGVEATKGRKDPANVKAFVAAAKEATNDE